MIYTLVVSWSSFDVSQDDPEFAEGSNHEPRVLLILRQAQDERVYRTVVVVRLDTANADVLAVALRERGDAGRAAIDPVCVARDRA
jgi:hypothetical protein